MHALFPFRQSSTFGQGGNFSPCISTICKFLQAVRLSRKLQAILKKASCTPRALWRRAQEVEPRLDYSWRNMKRGLTPAVRAERKSLAWQGRQRPRDFYLNLIYADESSVRPLPSRGKCLTKRGEHPIEDDARWLSLNFSLHFFLAVHPQQGLLHYQLLSRTKGHKRHGKYQVRILVCYNIIFIVRQAICNECRIWILFRFLSPIFEI